MKKSRLLVLPLAMLLTLTSCNGKAFIQKGFDMFDAEYQELLGEKLTYHVINYLVVNDEQDVYYYVTSSFSHSEDINEDYFAYHVELDTIEDLTKSQYQEIYDEYLNNELTGYAGTLLS